MTPQTLAVIGTFISFVAGILASRGLISKETADYLASPEALAVVGTVLGAAVAGYGLWRNRPKAVIADAGKALTGKGAIIAPAPIADSTATPSNVVKSLDEAKKLPGVPAA
jgi:hypothetical protein